jgi:hypothetical protein
VVAAAVLLPPLVNRTALDPAAVQRDVAAQYEQREGIPLDLRCADPMPVQVDRSYRCEGTRPDGEPVTITITVTSEDAEYTWAAG